jgi:hypothetical protein
MDRKKSESPSNSSLWSLDRRSPSLKTGKASYFKFDQPKKKVDDEAPKISIE